MLINLIENLSVIEWILYSIIIVSVITYITFNIIDTIKKNKEIKNKEKNKE